MSHHNVNSKTIIRNKLFPLSIVCHLIDFCRDRWGRRKAILTLIDWLLQEDDFRKITKKLKMLGLKTMDMLVCFCTFFVHYVGVYVGWDVPFFVKPKSREQFKWWISMRYQSRRILSLRGTKAAEEAEEEAEVALIKAGIGENGQSLSHSQMYKYYNTKKCLWGWIG